MSSTTTPLGPPVATPNPWKLVLLLLALLAAWKLRDVLLLVFASVLLAVLLRGAADRLAAATRLPAGLALLGVSLTAAGLLAAAFAWQGPRVADEAALLRERLPDAVRMLGARLDDVAGVRRLLDSMPSSSELIGDDGALVERVTAAATTTVGALTAAGLWLFVAFLLAISPQVYRDGLLSLFPDDRRTRTRAVLSRLGDTLWWWSLGRLMSMSFVGVTTGIGLWLLGIPLAFLLGLIAALLSFVPNVGPVIAAVPAVLLALADGPRSALWVVGLYVGIQAVESLLLDPLIDRRTVYLPPALTVVAQLVLGTIAGLLGVALAAPLTAAAMVLVSMLWIDGVLARRPAARGRNGTVEPQPDGEVT